MRSFGGLVLVGGLLAAGSGCVAWASAMHPIRAEGIGEVPYRPGKPVDPRKWVVEAKSAETSFNSGRNNLALQATVKEITRDHVVVQAHLTSTDMGNVDPNRFYVYLRSGDREALVTDIALGEIKDTPYAYTYNYTVEVKDGSLVFEDGSRIDIVHDETRTGVAEESYYSRDVTLTFEGDDLVPDDAKTIELELRDLGVHMEIQWKLVAPKAEPKPKSKAKGGK